MEVFPPDTVPIPRSFLPDMYGVSASDLPDMYKQVILKGAETPAESVLPEEEQPDAAK